MLHLKRWRIAEWDKQRAATLARELGVSLVIAGLLVACQLDRDRRSQRDASVFPPRSPS